MPSSDVAEVIVPCSDLAANLAFFTEQLAFRLEYIIPADAPRSAVIVGYGMRLRLERGDDASMALRLHCSAPAEVAGGELRLSAPNGTVIELLELDAPPELPPLEPSYVVSRLALAEWGEGRAGMRYRDLIPDRQGGRFIASHIQISAGGEVPDYVHFHKVQLQLIYCLKGWVRVVYEDQGPPFELQAGDCFLQPARIRHRVLESSPGLEVLELACPAEHATYVDHEMALPSAEAYPDRDFGGQRFLHHVAEQATWRPWRAPGFEARDVGIAAATTGLAHVHVVRAAAASAPALGAPATSHNAELLFTFVLAGTLTLACEGREHEQLVTGDAFVVPPKTNYAVLDCSGDLEFFELIFPDRDAPRT